VTDAWRTSPYHRAGSALAFPVDEGWHHFLRGPSEGERTSTWPGPDRMEWVYLNSHVQEVGGEGRSFVVFAAYFSQHLRFLVVRAWDREERYLGAWTGSAMSPSRTPRAKTAGTPSARTSPPDWRPPTTPVNSR
jgi:hypothetical protein